MAECSVDSVKEYFSSYAFYRVEYDSQSQNFPRSMGFVIGRSKHSDFQVAVTQVSRRHCEIHCDGDGWLLRNLSTNGTWLSGRVLTEVESVPLNDGDILLLGDIYIQCFLRIDSKQTPPVHILRFEVLVGKDQCTLNTQSLETARFKPEDCINSNSKDPEIEEVEVQDENVGVIKDNKIMELLEMQRRNKAILKQLEDCNKALMEVVTAKTEADQQIALLREELSNRTPCSIHELVENELQCSVCNELILNATTLNCSHTFCEYCLLRWKKKNNICPICRTGITSQNKTRMIDSLIDKVLPDLPRDFQERRRELAQSREDGRKDSTKKKRPSKRRRASNASTHRHALTIAIQGLSNLMDMDNTIDISSEEDIPVIVGRQRRRRE